MHIFGEHQDKICTLNIACVLMLALVLAKDLSNMKMLCNMKMLFVKLPVRKAPKGLNRIGKRILYYLRTCIFWSLNSFGWTTKHLNSVKSHYREKGVPQTPSVQFSHSVVSNSLQPHESQHTRPPCPSPTAGVHPSPCPLSW